MTRNIRKNSEKIWPAFQHKFKKLVLLPFKLYRIILAFILVMLIRGLRPFITLRMGKVDVGRIGGIYIGDRYLSEKSSREHKGRHFDRFYFVRSTHHVNLQWEIMWKRVLPYLPGTKIWEKTLQFNRLFPGYDDHEVQNHNVFPDQKTWQAHLRDPDGGKINVFNERLRKVLKNKETNISFNNEEEKHGQGVLENLGIRKGEQYICFHARDSAYLDAVLKTKDWSYHNYRDSNIQNYVPAAEEMANRGYYAVRMGAIVKDPIQSSHPRVIDYATNGQRNDFNDIYIGSHCRFFICSDGGISSIPEMFRIPVVYVNWAPILRISTWVLKGLFIFKKFFLKSEKRYMSFYEIMNLDFGGTNTNEIFEKLNLELHENTKDEIKAVTVEMDERLNCTWQTTDEDEELQQRFWDLFGPDKLKSPDLRIGTDFLRQNRYLLA